MWLSKITKLAVLAPFTLAVFSLHALSANDPPLPRSVMADKVVVLKSYRRLLLMKGDEVLKTYIVQLGGDPVGPKVQRGRTSVFAIIFPSKLTPCASGISK